MTAPSSAPCRTKWRDLWPPSPPTVRTTAVAERYPAAAVIVPPRSTAVPGETAETAPTQRDHHLQFIAVITITSDMMGIAIEILLLSVVIANLLEQKFRRGGMRDTGSDVGHRACIRLTQRFRQMTPSVR